jgi:DNA-binding NtrC family response regulator
MSKVATVLVLSYDRATRDVMRWVAGEVADEVHAASSWASAIQLASLYRPALAILDFDNLSPQGRVWLSQLLPLRYETEILVVGSSQSLEDALRHGLTRGFGKPLDAGALLRQVAAVIGHLK